MFMKQTFHNWADARSDCMSQGGDLFVINNAKELVGILAFCLDQISPATKAEKIK